MSNKKSEMIKQQVSANQGQASYNKSGHPVPGKNQDLQNLKIWGRQ